MNRKLLKLIEDYQTKVQKYQISIDVLPFSQCENLLYRKGMLEEVIEDLKKLIE